MQFSKKKSIFFLFVFLSAICLLFYRESNRYDLLSKEELTQTQVKLKTLSTTEKEDLAYFFDFAIFFCQYPYTLVGSKPMSICNYLQFSEDLPQILREDYERPIHRAFADRLERGYRVWEKYCHLFPQKNYLILRYHASISKGMNEIALIHHKHCLEIIQKNLGDFCQILQKNCTPEEVFEILTHPDHENFYKITQSHRLLGILLGFGRNNAHLYEHQKHDVLQSFTNEWPYWPRKWRLPCFASDPSTEETKHLKKLYKESRKFIRWTYWNRNDLEVTLALLEKER